MEAKLNQSEIENRGIDLM